MDPSFAEAKAGPVLTTAERAPPSAVVVVAPMFAVAERGPLLVVAKEGPSTDAVAVTTLPFIVAVTDPGLAVGWFVIVTTVVDAGVA